MRRLGVGCFVAVGLAAHLLAQAPERVTFDVVSIKPAAPSARPPSSRVQRGGLFTATNTPAEILISTAYQLRPYEFAAAGWVRTERFDITAKATGELVSAGSPQLRSALQDMLERRFKLVVHREERQLPIYALVVARPGRLGPDMNAMSVDCAELAAASRRAGTPPPSPDPCAVSPLGPSEIRGAWRIPGLVSWLGRSVDRPIFDRTGLTGYYNIHLRWNPGAFGGRAGAAVDAAPADIADAPSIFTAVEEQLGLKLEPATGPINVLVIEHIERPAED